MRWAAFGVDYEMCGKDLTDSYLLSSTICRIIGSKPPENLIYELFLDENAEKISKSLLKQALIMSVDGELKDLYFSIKKDCSVKIFTAKDPEGLEVIRHDTAHIMAMAVQELYPGTQVTIGPVIENGFYYDFAREEPFTENDLEKIEKRMLSHCERSINHG